MSGIPGRYKNPKNGFKSLFPLLNPKKIHRGLIIMKNNLRTA